MYNATMEFSLEKSGARYRIEAYSPGGITISGHVYQHSVAVMPEQLLSPWGPSTASALLPLHFEQLLPLKPEVVLLGMQEPVYFPKLDLFSCLTDMGVGLEIMSMAAACRTYAILMTEGRAVIAAFVIDPNRGRDT